MEQTTSQQSLVDPGETGVDASPAFVVDATDLSIVTANNSAAATFGYDAAQLVGTPIATLVVAPDELLIRDHIQAVAQHQGNGNGNGDGNGRANGSGSLHALIVNADGSIASSRLAVSVEASQAAVATVVVEIDPLSTELGAGAHNGDEPEPGTAAWLVHQINRGELADGDVGIALFHSRTCRFVAANDAYDAARPDPTPAARAHPDRRHDDRGRRRRRPFDPCRAARRARRVLRSEQGGRHRARPVRRLRTRDRRDRTDLLRRLSLPARPTRRDRSHGDRHHVRGCGRRQPRAPGRDRG